MAVGYVPLGVIDDRPLYGKQFCDMEFICVPKRHRAKFSHTFF